MSLITKIFVVLLVLSSLVLTSAVVVYVNRDQVWAQKVTESKREADLAREARNQADQAASSAKLALQDAVRVQQGQITALMQDLKGKDQTISSLNVQIAELNAKYTDQTAKNTTLADALKVSQNTQSHQQDIIASTRKTVDELTAKNRDMGETISELNNRLDTITREWRWFQEQLTEAKKQIGDLSKVLKDHGIDIKTALASAIGIKQGAPPINAVVKEVRPIEGVPYATISVGSVDNVVKGMRFHVFDRDKGEFLGFLTVETVESKEATGRLDGPKIADIKTGVEARTQL